MVKHISIILEQDIRIWYYFKMVKLTFKTPNQEKPFDLDVDLGQVTTV